MGGHGSAPRVGAASTGAALAAGLALWLVAFGAGTSVAAQGSWPVVQMRTAEAQTVATGRGVTIGLVDSGIDPNAPDVRGRLIASADCLGSSGEAGNCRAGPAPDTVGHGTVVASVVSQVAPDARFVAARAVAGRVGGDDDVAAGVDWVVAHGAQVVNISIAGEDAGGVFLTRRLAEAVERAWARGAVPVLAAGNMGGASPYGALDALVAAATTADGSLAVYSERTSTAKWGLAAPGSVVMTLPRGLQVNHAGTSIAAPNVAGAVALLLQHGDGRDGAVQRLVSTAVPCAGCGHGRIDVAAALGIARPVVVPTTRAVAPPRPALPLPVPVLPDPVVPDSSLLDRAPSLDT